MTSDRSDKQSADGRRVQPGFVHCKPARFGGRQRRQISIQRCRQLLTVWVLPCPLLIVYCLCCLMLICARLGDYKNEAFLKALRRYGYTLHKHTTLHILSGTDTGGCRGTTRPCPQSPGRGAIMPFGPPQKLQKKLYFLFYFLSKMNLSPSQKIVG